MDSNRRPLRSRQTILAMSVTNWLMRRGFKPNQISLLSMVFAAFSAIALVLSAHVLSHYHIILLLLAAFFILMRLLCNLFDGMLAIEKGLKSRVGEIYNDLPDRPSDCFIFIAAGYACSVIPDAIELGWLTALLAVMTAYVRLLGSLSGSKQYFVGPMAKQHRMFLMIVACLLGAIFTHTAWILVPTLIVIAVGSLITILHRVKLIFQELGGA